MITLVAAMSENRVIGVDNKIPWYVPEDFAHFKSYTMGKTLIMGRKTFESIGKPLPFRRTIVVTTNKSWSYDNIDITHSIDEALRLCNGRSEIIIAGGGNIYEQTIDIADKMVLSIIPMTIDGGDAFFPNFNVDDWYSPEIEHKNDFRIETYLKK